jgi:hypothetical protein
MRGIVLSIVAAVLGVLTLLVIGGGPFWLLGIVIADIGNPDPPPILVEVFFPLIVIASLWALLWLAARLTGPKSSGPSHQIRHIIRSRQIRG